LARRERKGFEAMISEKAIRVFEKLSGWTEKSKFEAEHNGYVTIEEDVMTGEANAFLWTVGPLEDHHIDHLQYMHLGDHIFVKK
jgi:hypothetical protein